MKRLILSLIFLLIFNSTVFADNPFDDLKNWTSFFVDKGITYSYEHSEDSSSIPEIYKPVHRTGCFYFYVKVTFTPERGERIQKELIKENVKQLANNKIDYILEEYRINLINKTATRLFCYFYSDKNISILTWDMSKLEKAKPLKGSMFEQIPFDNNPFYSPWAEKAQRMQNETAFNDQLKKLGAEKLVPISQLETNPYEFEGHIIAVVALFRKMLSKHTASFYSGTTDLENYTNVTDEIIVSGIPTGTDFEPGIFAPRVILILRGKGATQGWNAFGAPIKASHFQWIAERSFKWKPN